MTFFIQFRTALRQYFANHEEWVVRMLRFGFSLVSLLMVNHVFGYQKTLSHWWVSLLVALICMFLPIRGISIVIIFISLMQLMTLSAGVAAVALVLAAVSYAVCAYFNAKDTYNVITAPVCSQLHIPFAVPVVSGLFSDFSEIASVACGSMMAFYLKTVKENAPGFLDETADMTVSGLLQNQLLGNSMFYIYLISMVVCFMLVYYIRNLNIKYAWFLAVTMGVVVEFIIMLSGCLFVGKTSDIPSLILGNMVVFLIGIGMVFFFQGLDYTRTERVQFEDDEYYYYVTAVPKARIVEQKKEVKKITEKTQNR